MPNNLRRWQDFTTYKAFLQAFPCASMRLEQEREKHMSSQITAEQQEIDRLARLHVSDVHTHLLQGKGKEYLNKLADALAELGTEFDAAAELLREAAKLMPDST